MSCSASLLFSISWLKLPQREYSGGISVFLIQPPLAYIKKSSCGFTDVSMFFGSRGGGFFSTLVEDSARKLNTQMRHKKTSGVNLIIGEETRRLRSCPLGLE